MGEIADDLQGLLHETVRRSIAAQKGREMRKAFKYRLYPNAQQAREMQRQLDSARSLYNSALHERRDAWETSHVSITYYDQSSQLKGMRTLSPDLASVNFSMLQATLRQLQRSFDAFFRRVKKGEAPGYPRFRSSLRWDSITFPSYGDGCKLHADKGRVYFQGVGHVKVKLHRPIEGTIKTLTLKREADGWHVIFSCDLGDAQAPPSTAPPVGIDLGLTAFLVTSEGETVAPPRFFRRAEKALRRAQRQVARCQKGSQRRRKAVRLVAKQHQHVAHQRRDFHHKTARGLIQAFGVIAHENLNVKGITRTRLAKSTHDAGWAQFLAILHSKAECAGVLVVGVDARHTTQECSRCGALPEKRLTLADRTYHCASCGLERDRDHNAAINIKQRLGLSRQALTLAGADVA